MKITPFSRALREAIESTGLSDAAFATAADLPPSTISSYKLARVTPSAQRLEKIITIPTLSRRHRRELLTTYFLDIAPTGYAPAIRATFQHWHEILEAAETLATPPRDEELDRALTRLLIIAPKKKHVRELLETMAKVSMR